MQEQRGYSDDELKPFREELEFVRKAEKDPEDSFSDLIGEADSFGKLNALQAQLDALQGTGELEDKEFGKRQDLINKAFDRLIEVNRRNAEKDGSNLMYFPITSTGTIGADGQMVTVRDGKYFDAAGAEIDVAKGKLLPPESYETFVRNYNNQADRIATDVTEGVNAIQSLVNYRMLVIDQPQGLNNYISIAGKLVGEANSIKSALEGISTGQYGYTTFENRVMSAIRDLSAEDARIARAQLRAAYAMATFSGSSGQALSDRELIQNLKAVGQGLTDPRKVVSIINDNIDDVVTLTEQKRAGKFNSFIASDALKATMSNTPIGMPFIDYLNTTSAGVDEATRRQFLDALNGKVDYNFTQEAGGSLSEMTFDEFKEDLKSRSPQVYDSYSEDDLRDYFTSNGGQL
jgi:hypothetical protein